jgi:hypothetical protein
MTRTGIRIVLLLILQTLWAEQSFAVVPVDAQFTEELSKQEQIYKSTGEQRPDGYVIDRSLLSYVYTLSAGFGRALAILGAKDRWLDIGAGRGQAVLDYFAGKTDAMNVDLPARVEEKAQVVAISIEDRRTPLWQQAASTLPPDQMRYLAGRRMGEYSLRELGQFRIITDVIGGFSYSLNLSVFMEKVLEVLELNGDFYTLLQDVHAEEGTNKPYYAGASYLTEIAGADGAEVKVCSWLKSIACVAVTCELKTDWKPYIEKYHVRKICNDVKVPALVSTHFEAGTPPERKFQMGKN